MASTQIPTHPQERPRPSDAAPDQAGDAAARQLLTFLAGGRLYGCDVGGVREIIPARRCTRLPGAPHYVRGLTNLRGTIVTVIDLPARLGAARRASEAAAAPAAAPGGVEGSIILAEHGSKVVGLAVDGVREVRTIAPSDVDPFGAVGDAAPADVPAEAGVVAGLAQLGGEVVIVLDVQTILRQLLT